MVALLLLMLLVLFPFLPGGVQAQGTFESTHVLTLQNDTTTGTGQNLLAKKVPGPGGMAKLTMCTPADTTTECYVVIINPGTTGNATYVTDGLTSCIMDGTNASGVGGKDVVVSPTTNGQCHVLPSGHPSNGMAIGTMQADTTATGATALIDARNKPYIPGSVSGSGVNTGVAHALAYYPAAGTVVDDLPGSGTGTTGQYLKFGGTDWQASTGSASGVGVCTNQVITAANSDAVPTCSTVTATMTDTTIAKTGTDITASGQVNQATGAFAFVGDLRPTTLSGDINDYNPTGLATATGLFVDGGTSDRNWTGLAGGSDGRQMPLCNRGTTNELVLRSQSASSAAANRFALGGDIRLRPEGCLWVQYDSTAQRWRPATNAMQDHFAKRPCQFAVGDPSTTATPPLAVDQNTPDACGNDYGADWVIESFACKTDAGTTTVNPILTGGTPTSILTAAVVCTTSWTAGTLSGTPTLHPFSSNGATCSVTPCTLAGNFTAVDGTARLTWFKFGGRLQK